MTHAIAPLLKRFFSHYLPVQKGLSPNTVRAYRDAIKLLLCYAADTLGQSVDTLSVEAFSEKLVLGFLDALERDRGCTKRTRNARLAAIRSLFAFIAREEPELVLQSQQIRAIPLKRTEHKTIEYLEEKAMQAVFDAVDINSRTGFRDRALLLLLYNTGARASEVINQELADMRPAVEVEQDPVVGDGVELELPGVERAAARRGRPVDALEVVARAVVAHAAHVGGRELCPAADHAAAGEVAGG